MKHFAAFYSPSKKFSAVVIATGINVPQDDLDGVAQELRRLQVNGHVVFDLLIANGTKSHRFFSINFDGKGFPITRLKCVEADMAVREASAKFLCEHLAEVDLSLLSPAMRFAVSRGIAV